MKTLTKENFVKFLVKHNACQLYLTLAQNQESARDIIEKCLSVYYLYWLILVIGGPLWAEFSEKRDPLWAEYCDKRDVLWAKYGKRNASLLAEYKKQWNNIVRELCTFERVQEAIGN